MDNKDEQALVATLESAGIAAPKLKSIKKLEFSKADKAGNKRVHEATNRIILDLLAANELGQCIHVTGEMRALTDPFHRQLCVEMQRKDRGNFHVLYYIPEQHRRTATSVVNWNLSRWATSKKRVWEEELRSIGAIANRSVDLRAYNTLGEIQYSVFGNKYVLLQEQHNDQISEKRVWLLESERINNLLTERGMALIANAVDIDERLFRDFVINLSGVASRRYLTMLTQHSINKHRLLEDRIIQDFAPNPIDSLDALKVMGFVTEDDQESVSITATGHDFFRSY